MQFKLATAALFAILGLALAAPLPAPTGESCNGAIHTSVSDESIPGVQCLKE
ncbi:hypothetical protein P280DRAFT_466722 [Massarina eburnea CBS 473.64]|uniref:Uncharacterized protein n=1 Tax=Massarina eburnea CBS 473.64 TaxID=1395130 RepID=A0A6A6SCW5_9PLEO|nr:hypothetical protein P280DRAFT_466722 [Massarina eburnea CBS 473.64]